MMLLALLKKDFLIVKKYVLIMVVVAALIPPFMRWRTPEFMGDFGFILSVIFSVFMLLQYVSIKEYQFPKAATYLCAAPFSRKMMVLSKYVFCMVIYMLCCVIYGIETFVIPGLGALDIKLFALMFLAISAFIGIYLPIQYKLGFDKTKYIFAVIIIFSPIYLPVLMRMKNPGLGFLSELPPYFLYSSIVLIGFAVLAISASLSVKIYSKADLA